MLSIAKLTPGQEGYYERSVAAGLDEYYEGHGESPGVWVGRGAGELQLEGVVHEGELGRLIRGNHPHTQKELRRHPKARMITIERIDPLTDERWIETKRLAPVAGFDLVFSPPKSVSLLHALGDEDTRRGGLQGGEAGKGHGGPTARAPSGNPQVLDPPHPGHRGADAPGKGWLLRCTARGRRHPRTQGTRRPRRAAGGLARPGGGAR